MKILFVGAEVAPFVSVGGLSQVSYFLPRALQKRGNDVRIFTARHGAMDEVKEKFQLKMKIKSLKVPVASENDKKKRTTKQKYIACRVSTYSKTGEPTTYFLENREYYELRANVFGYKDDHVRFALLSKGILEALLQMKKKKDTDWWPDLIHANDWHTGYFIDMAREDPRYKKLLENIPIVFTVHNFFYQGNINFRYIHERERDTGSTPLMSLDSPRLLRQNPLLRGLIYADEVNTVSPTHAIEVLTPEYAEGLDKTLNKIRGKLTGILNGLDTKEFNPETDPLIIKNYSISSFAAARRVNKANLQKEFGLEEKPDAPIIAVLGRISAQKGWELILDVLPHLLVERPNVQIIVLGQGDEKYQNDLINIQRRFPNQVGLHMQRDFRLPRKIYSGADMILIPSLFEPGGIVALEALRYGTVPIVRRTGGLNDVVADFNPNTGVGNGFSFTQKSPWSLYGSIVSALSLYENSKLWNTLVRNCLKSDFSWDQTAGEYDRWYQKALEERRRATDINPSPAYKITVEK
ncbi:MAG TPA: glycogen/starch synthase [Patescibacteria group bacterium]|nr:glycogen/starch synthase [Patescibacteria group bacterium]